MTFRLLQLPYLVFTDIINQLEPNELIILSFCSQKLHRLVKQHRNKSRKWPLFIFGHIASFISVEAEETRMLLGVCSDRGTIAETISIGDHHQIPCTFPSHLGVLATYWKDRAEGFRAIAAYILDFLNITEIKDFQFSFSNMEALDWLYERGIRIRTVYSMDLEEHTPIPTEDFSLVFSKCKFETLLLTNEPEEDFYYEGSFYPYDYIYIKFGFWVTIENLKSMDFKKMTIGSSYLNSSDINQFLKHWLEMGNPRLKYWNIELDGHFVFDEIDVEIRDRLQLVQEEREYAVQGKIRKFQQSHDLRREGDGVIMTLFWQQLATENDEIWIMVWPDEMEKTHQQNVEEAIEGDIIA